MCLSPGSPAQYGSAGWAPGQKEDDDISTIPTVPTAPKVVVDNSETWDILGRVFFFGVIVAVVAMYIRSSRKKSEREDVGYEKNKA